MNILVLVIFRVLFSIMVPALLLMAGIKSTIKIIKGVKESLRHSKGWKIYYLNKFLKTKNTQNHMRFLAVLVICVVLPPMAVVVATIYLTNLSWLATISARNQLKAMGLNPDKIIDPNEVNKIIAKTISESLGKADLEQDGVLIYSSKSAKSMLANSGEHSTSRMTGKSECPPNAAGRSSPTKKDINSSSTPMPIHSQATM